MTSRNLRDRVAEAGGPDAFQGIRREELQLGIRIVMMRREGSELMVGKPQVLTKEVDGKLMELQEPGITSDAWDLKTR